MNGRAEDTKVEAVWRRCETKGMGKKKNRLGLLDSQTGGGGEGEEEEEA